MAGGQLSTVWHDRRNLGPSAEEDTRGLEVTTTRLRDIVQGLRDEGFPDSRIVLGGFSMGGGCSLFSVYSGAAGSTSSLLSLGGAFSISSWVTSKSSMWPALDQAATSGTVIPPALLIHGSHDSLISPAWGQATLASLESKGVPVEWFVEEGIAHEPGPRGLQLLGEWLLRTIPPL